MNTLAIAGATALTALILAIAPSNSAALQTNPLPAGDPEPVSVLQAPVSEPKKVPRVKPQPPCSDDLSMVLWKAGFRDTQLAMAWAIVMRESRGENIVPGDPRFNGEDYGIFQLNKPTWGGQPWWDDDTISTVQGNARIAYELTQERGFGAWGLTNDGQFNFSSYGGWSDWQKENWIVRPYLRYLTEYWETCNGWNHEETQQTGT
jgi:hypothetical protein